VTTTQLDTLSRPLSAVDGTSDYATASRRTSICTSVTSVNDFAHSTVSSLPNLMGHSHTHTHTHCAGMAWDGLCVAMQCCVISCTHINIHMYKMADDDDDDVLMLSEYHKQAHAY